MRASVWVLAIVCACTSGRLEADDFYYGTFPEDFVWSSATSAYQIEGGWNADGKGRNIWDTFTDNPENIEDKSDGNIACDSYNKYEVDVQLLKAMGVKMYRFSLSWARVLPVGTLDEVNEAGITYYNNLIDNLLQNDIIPMVTLYHWDLPQALEDQDGWFNDSIIIHFKNYAQLMFDRLDKVQYWLTFNEPFVFCWLGYGLPVHAPGRNQPGEGAYTCSHNVIRAHAQAYHAYNDSGAQGLISITLDSDWKEPKDADNPSDVQAANRAMQFKLGWFAHPIFVNGDYPEIMKEKVAEKSAAQGFNQSRLPEFTEEEKDYIVGTHDYFGLNHYTTQLITELDRGIDDPSYENDQDVEETRDPGWPTTGSDWLRVVPWGLRKLLNFIKENYGDVEVYVTENGCSDRNTTEDNINLRDEHRTNYYRSYINEMLKAIRLDDCKVRGYAAWSLMDNFEWAGGYTQKFGLHYVDFNDPERPRVPKDSAQAYAQIIRDNGFPEPSGSAWHKALTPWIIVIATLCASKFI